MVAYAFNAQQYAPTFSAGGGLPVNPDGTPAKYRVVIADSESRPTKDNQGNMLCLDCKVIEGPFSGQSQEIRLNLHNKSQQAVEIAHKQLTAISHAVGMFAGFQDTMELHNKPFWIEISKQPNNPQYTQVSNVYDNNGNDVSKPGQVQQQAAPQQPPPPVTPQSPPPGQWQQPGQGAPPAAPQGNWQPPQGQPPQQAQAPAQPPGQWQPPAGQGQQPPQQWSPPQAQPAPTGQAGAPPWGQR